MSQIFKNELSNEITIIVISLHIYISLYTNHIHKNFTAWKYQVCFRNSDTKLEPLKKMNLAQSTEVQDYIHQYEQ